MKLKYLLMAAVSVLLLVSTNSCSVHRSSKRTTDERVDEHSVAVRLPKKRRKIIDEAKTWLGTPYKYAKQTKGKGTDCSGMVMQVYNTVLQYKLPRNSARQAEHCRKIKASKVLPGDLVFFATGSNPEKVSHVGIMVDSDSFIHASSSKGVVISKLSNPWYSKRLLMFGRVPVFDD